MQKLTQEQVLLRLEEAKKHAGTGIAKVGQVIVGGVVIFSRVKPIYEKSYTFGSRLINNHSSHIVRSLMIDGQNYTVSEEMDSILRGIENKVHEIRMQRFEAYGKTKGTQGR